MNNKAHTSKAGFGLLEVMFAAVIIAIMVIGGSAAMYYTGSNIVVQGHRRIALQLADQRLEHARENYYYNIVPPTYFEDTGNIYYLTADNTDPYKMVLKNSLQTELFTLDGIDYAMTTSIVRYRSMFSPECIEISATVEYRSATGEDVQLSTVILPPETSN